ncbi:hypothetical protein FXV91_19005 [Methanosarcina sp. DH2]|uniref:hypothetical protein n=1 Tax=Methanosarcina sp. DH2 TaxID=2605639 RepID=UPI001E5155EF|nr:hypothetical protein [Methanosarcina sp. DH2]MCC4772173.1 hypothetical protein [Methanosarcina sp. DH2]
MLNPSGSPLERSEKDRVLPRRNSGRKGPRAPDAKLGRDAIRGEKDRVLPRRNSGRKGPRAPDAKLGRDAIRGLDPSSLPKVKKHAYSY